MRKVLIGVFITVILVFVLQYCQYRHDDREQLELSSQQIQKQLTNVGKLIVTEGNYAEVLTFEDSKGYFRDLISQDKKALVIVNAKASVAYDLRQVTTEIDPETKTVFITDIPEPELSINPKIEYYDIQEDYFNQFEAEDYNSIRDRVEANLKEKIEASELMTNAENRLISELHKIYILTSSLGWTLQFDGNEINSQEDLQAVDAFLN